MGISKKVSERPIQGGALIPVYVAGTDDDASIVINGAPVSITNPLPVSVIEEEELTVSGTFAAAGDNQILAAPGANYRIVVSSFLIQNESAVATTMILRSGATNNAWRALGQNQGDGFAMAFSIGTLWKLNTNEALNLNLSGANQCNYSVMYHTELV